MFAIVEWVGFSHAYRSLELCENDVSTEAELFEARWQKQVSRLNCGPEISGPQLVQRPP